MQLRGHLNRIVEVLHETREKESTRRKPPNARQKPAPSPKSKLAPALHQLELAVRHSSDFVGAFDLE